MTTQEETIELVEDSPLMDVLELRWTDFFSIHLLLMAVKSALSAAQNDDDLPTKRFFSQLLTQLRKLCKKCKEAKLDIQSQISFEKFKELLKKEGFFMKLYTLQVQDEFLKILSAHLKEAQQPTSSSFVGTLPTTSTSCTIARGTKRDASALDPIASEATSDHFEDLFLGAPSVVNGGKISSFISNRMNENTCFLKLEETSGYEVIKLEVYKMQEIISLDKMQWWKKAQVRSMFVTKNSRDPLKAQIEAVLFEAGKRMATHPDVVKEVKKSNY